MIIDQILDYLVDNKNLSDRQFQLFNEIASVFIEFPIDNEPPSSAAVSLASNCGASLPHALASGLNCISSQHLPIEQIAYFISNNYRKNIKQVLSENKNSKILGYGHPSIQGKDERVEYLLENFKDLISEHAKFCINLEKAMPVNMNIGGAIAALSLDNGVSAENCLFLPLIGRMFGWLKLYNKTKTRFNKVVPSFEIIKHEYK